jgi:hypothetical protein
MPLAKLIRDTAHAVVEALGLEQKEVVVEGLATRWQRGTLVMQPAERSLQPKEVPLETFFHKIVMIRNNPRVLEQKVNASDKLSEADKFDLQQYITRCYGSLTTFQHPVQKHGRPVPNQRSGQAELSAKIFITTRRVEETLRARRENLVLLHPHLIFGL